MISLKINNIKNFTSHLLVKNTFEDMLLVEGLISTHSTFSINGHINSGYYSQEDLENLSCIPGKNSYSSWKLLRPVCYEIIKGKNLPTSFKFVLKLNDAQISALLDKLSDFKIEDVAGLFLNIRYENGNLTIVTGTSMNIFTLDKTLDKAFDTYITHFLENNSIEYDIC